MPRRSTRSRSAATARRPRTRSPSAWASRPRRRRGCASSSASLGLVDHVPYKGVELTDDGERVALEVIRHHRLLELYLAESLDVPWDRVHAEAEVLEHVLSEELEELIAAKLGNPTVDPHGDPIPTADLVIEERPTERAGRPRRRRRARPSCASPTPTRRCCATWPSAASRPATTSRSSTSSRSTARPSPASATTSTCWAARWRAPCGVRRSSTRSACRARLRPLRWPTLSGCPRRVACSSCSRAVGCAGRSPCSGRPSSPASPTSTPATSPRTSPAAPSTATCCCGSCSARTSWRC